MGSKCYLCNFDKSTVLISADKEKTSHPQHHVVYRYCKRCSFVFLDIDYEAWKSKYEEPCSATLLEEWANQQRREGKSLMDYQKKFIPTLLQSGQKVLDVGCSVSGCLSVYKEHGWKVYGVEPNPDLTKYGRQRFGIKAQTTFYNPELFPREYFDLIFSYGTLEHCVNPFEVIQSFNLHLKNGGFLHLELPNLLFTDVWQFGWGHISMFTPNILRQLLERSGFEVIDFHSRKLFPEYTDSMGLICKKVRSIEQVSPLFTVDNNWHKDNQLFLKLLLWLEFHIGVPKISTILWHLLLMLFRKLRIIPLLKSIANEIRKS